MAQGFWFFWRANRLLGVLRCWTFQRKSGWLNGNGRGLLGLESKRSIYIYIYLYLFISFFIFLCYGMFAKSVGFMAKDLRQGVEAHLASNLAVPKVPNTPRCGPFLINTCCADVLVWD